MDISTALYLADVAESLNDVCSFLGMVSCIALLILIAVKFAVACEVADKDDDNKELPKSVLKFQRTINTTLVVAILFTITGASGSILAPEKDTIYMMIGVEATEAVFQSETSKKVFTLINQQLDKYIDKAE